jgi:hypothetical protein
MFEVEARIVEIANYINMYGFNDVKFHIEFKEVFRNTKDEVDFNNEKTYNNCYRNE